MEESRISNYFLTGGLRTPGISYEVANKKLTIVIDSKQLSVCYHTWDTPYLQIGYGNDLFWVKEKRNDENTTVYTVSHIVQHGPDVEFRDSTSKKVSDVFPGISYADSITVIVK